MVEGKSEIMENGYMLEMKNVSKSFGGLQALSHVNLELRHNEILGLVGDNAAGKSTLMKILTGAYRADEGKIFFKGKEVQITSPYTSRRLGIEMIYQNLALCPDLDVASNLFLGREVTRAGIFNILRKKRMIRETLRILHGLRIDVKDPTVPVSHLSGGQQQAIAIGKATSFNPKIVLMDEPTANLASKEVDKVLELILLLKNRSISIIVISHRLNDIFRVSDRIFILRAGRKVAVKETAKTDRDRVIKLMFDWKLANSKIK